MFTTCHMSCVTCDMSPVTCHMSNFFLFYFFLDKVVKLVWGGSVINRPTPSSFCFMLQTYLCGLRKLQNIFCVHSKLHISKIFKVILLCRSHLIFVKIYLIGSLCFYGFHRLNKPKHVTRSVSYHTQQPYP